MPVLLESLRTEIKLEIGGLMDGWMDEWMIACKDGWLDR